MVVSAESMRAKIYLIRGANVMLDRDLAFLYGVTTGNLNRAVKRNLDRFPEDFMFQLTKSELKDWVFQFGIPISDKMGMRILPHVFTEQGVAMLSSVLKSKLAVQINISIMRAFVEIRGIAVSNPGYQPLSDTIKQIESRVDALEANHLVEHMTMSGKMMQSTQELRRLSDAFDQFQDANIVIRRPVEGFGQGF